MKGTIALHFTERQLRLIIRGLGWFLEESGDDAEVRESDELKTSLELILESQR